MKTNITSIIITFSVLLVLVLASPTEAARFDIDGTDGTVNMGGSYEFDVVIDPEGDTFDSLSVKIMHEGDQQICAFTFRGNSDNLGNNGHEYKSDDQSDACKGIKITTPGQGYGYSYGYGYGYGAPEYRYRIRIMTSNGFVNRHGDGDYHISFLTDDPSTSDSVTLTVSPKKNGKKN